MGNPVAKLLIVDDSTFMTSVIRNFAQKAGKPLDILEAHSGEEAIEKYYQFRPDLVFLDIKMGGMDGLEALEQINADGKAKVVMCTSLNEEALVRRAMAAGAVAYITKPFRSEEIIAVIQKFVP
jgi:two-component system, chemotaxis family, chemotaxis protein CheY